MPSFHVRISRDGRSWNGSGVSTDIVESVIKAYLFAINLWSLNEQERQGKMETNTMVKYLIQPYVMVRQVRVCFLYKISCRL